MGRLTATPEVASLLKRLTEATEIRDAQGQLLGIFTPQAAVADDQERLKALFDLEEAQRILASGPPPGRPLREILRELEGAQGAPQ